MPKLPEAVQALDTRAGIIVNVTPKDRRRLEAILLDRSSLAEEKIRIVLEGLRGEDSIAELCRREGIVQNLYCRWSKAFIEAAKKRLAGDTARAATSDEVKELRPEASALKEVVAELTLENCLIKKV
jgi:transposase